MEQIGIRDSKDTLPIREKIIEKLNSDIAGALETSENAKQVAEEFDRIFLKLLRLIKYSTEKNNAAKSEIENQTDNLLRKLSKFLRQKPLDKKVQLAEKMQNEQKAFFDDICSFINHFVTNKNLSDVHNSIPRTSLQDFSKKSVWNQLFQNVYDRNRWMEWSAEWWSCSYWTILLYNFFNKLKEAWLDLNITFFRYKNLNDSLFRDIITNRHSWLIINFQWEDYMVDHDWLIYYEDQSIVRPLSTYIDKAYAKNKSREIELFESFKYKKETSMIKFFDKEDEFIEHFEQYPPDYRISFYVKFPDNTNLEKVTFSFRNHYILLKINETEYTFYLKDNMDLREHNFAKILMNKLYIKNRTEVVTNEDKEMFKKYFNLIKNKINTQAIIKHYQELGDRKAETITQLWNRTKVIVYKNPYTWEFV